MSNIYTNTDLKYPLTASEYNDIDLVWNFISIFASPFIYVTDYRNQLIETIKKYDMNEFYYLENITNKLFWNLRWEIFTFFLDSDMDKQEYITIPKELLRYSEIKYEGNNDMNKKIKDIELDTFYRSFINKLIFVDAANQIIYHKNMEGSADIFSKNKFNLFTLTALFDRKVYEKIMLNPHNNLDIELSQYYYQYDYGFPNLNCCVYNFDNEENRKYRIKKMYYENDSKNWFRIINKAT